MTALLLLSFCSLEELFRVTPSWNATILLLAHDSLHSFQLFNISILNHMASYPSKSAHSFDMRASIVAHHGLSDPMELFITSDFLHRCRYIAVAHIWTCGEKKLGNPWQLAGAMLELAICDGMRAMDVLIGRMRLQDGCHVKISHSRKYSDTRNCEAS